MKIFNFLSETATACKNLITKILILSAHENIIAFRIFLFLFLEKLSLKALFSLTIKFSIYEF